MSFTTLSPAVCSAQTKLTILLAAIAVPLNTIFGVVAALQLTRNDFPGKAFVLTLLDLPFSISPVVTGLMLVLLYGRNGILAPYLDSLGLQVVFAFPGMALATLFVTMPFVVRELMPILEVGHLGGLRGRECVLVVHGVDGGYAFKRQCMSIICISPPYTPTGAGHRRRGCCAHTGSIGMGCVYERDAAQHQVGLAVWHHLDQCGMCAVCCTRALSNMHPPQPIQHTHSVPWASLEPWQ